MANKPVWTRMDARKRLARQCVGGNTDLPASSACRYLRPKVPRERRIPMTLRIDVSRSGTVKPYRLHQQSCFSSLGLATLFLELPTGGPTIIIQKSGRGIMEPKTLISQAAFYLFVGGVVLIVAQALFHPDKPIVDLVLDGPKVKLEILSFGAMVTGLVLLLVGSVFPDQPRQRK
jgi:hypothetical protein